MVPEQDQAHFEKCERGGEVAWRAGNMLDFLAEIDAYYKTKAQNESIPGGALHTTAEALECGALFGLLRAR